VVNLDKPHPRKLHMEAKGEGVKPRAENDDLLDALMEGGADGVLDVSLAKEKVELNPRCCQLLEHLDEEAKPLLVHDVEQ
jgi:hypothetical protein